MKEKSYGELMELLEHCEKGSDEEIEIYKRMVELSEKEIGELEDEEDFLELPTGEKIRCVSDYLRDTGTGSCFTPFSLTKIQTSFQYIILLLKKVAKLQSCKVATRFSGFKFTKKNRLRLQPIEGWIHLFLKQYFCPLRNNFCVLFKQSTI